jgi:hypothetical protein
METSAELSIARKPAAAISTVVPGAIVKTAPPVTRVRLMCTQPGPTSVSSSTAFGRVSASAQLRRLHNASGCTAYYDGQRRDAWQEPSEIDLVWARDLAESIHPDTQVRSGTHCAEERCRDFRSTDAYPVRDYELVSDHCPVVLDLSRADDDE